ncbi:uncharacterized protein N7483_003257 [Penicillium malachiteum]|uniref:uncharacterized protein n=1 Tax=Penicillium malachiteum TaxID=1324776 RepID=UPI00254811A8|nr:uncharacterized protein N7483_003257 [Penicillium malachiteum]KAJ5728749.1 hypothetical protein N7483_003257 [Penicillium malachiteum]
MQSEKTPLHGPINEKTQPYLFAIKHLIDARAGEILHKSNFGGGWEKWLQLEVAAELDMPHTIDVLCEQSIWPGSSDRVDLWLQDPQANYQNLNPADIAEEQCLFQLRRRQGFIQKHDNEQLKNLGQIHKLGQQVGIELKCRTYLQKPADLQAKFLEDVVKIHNKPLVSCKLVALAVTVDELDVHRELSKKFGNVEVYWDRVSDHVPIWLLYVEVPWKV